MVGIPKPWGFPPMTAPFISAVWVTCDPALPVTVTSFTIPNPGTNHVVSVPDPLLDFPASIAVAVVVLTCLIALETAAEHTERSVA